VSCIAICKDAFPQSETFYSLVPFLSVSVPTIDYLARRSGHSHLMYRISHKLSHPQSGSLTRSDDEILHKGKETHEQQIALQEGATTIFNVIECYDVH